MIPIKIHVIHLKLCKIGILCQTKTEYDGAKKIYLILSLIYYIVFCKYLLIVIYMINIIVRATIDFVYFLSV